VSYWNADHFLCNTNSNLFQSAIISIFKFEKRVSGLKNRAKVLKFWNIFGWNGKPDAGFSIIKAGLGIH